MTVDPALDFKALYESAPGLFLVLKPDTAYTILGASDGYLKATLTQRKDIVGRGLFDVFTDGLDAPQATSTLNLRASLERVKKEKRPNSMAVQKYDVLRPEAEGTGTVERFWISENSPVLAKNGELSYITHRIEDVTAFVSLSRLDAQHQQRSDARQEQSDSRHQEILSRSEEQGAATNQELRRENVQLATNSEIDATAYKELSLANVQLSEYSELKAAANKALKLANEQLSEYSELKAVANKALRLANKQLSDASELDATANKKLTLANEKLAEDSVHDAADNKELTLANEELKRERAERKKAEETLSRIEEQLRQAQKMEAVGRLAGGVAHDFNNILSVILGYADLLLERSGIEESMRRDVEQILKAGGRAADLTRQLLAFSRQQVVEAKVLDLNGLILDMDPMLRRLIGEDIEFRTVPKDGLGRIKADKSHLEQVVMNLVVNARDAMPQGGVLVVETADVDLDEAYAREHIEVTPGPYVMLAVSDTGKGMDELTKSRIFEPFFTTKEKGRGTGLGLSTVYGIVKQAGGNVWVYSETGQGTTFRLYFPRFTGADEASGAAPIRTPILKGTETILLAEDDVQLRTMVRGILLGNGYHVLEAQNAPDALAIAEKHAGTIDLLLTDVIMPKMNGRQLAVKLVAQRPGLRVLYMSGYTENVIIHHNVLDEGLVLLQKPFSPQALLRKVRDVIGAPHRPAGA